jgi:hypothetical protein
MMDDDDDDDDDEYGVVCENEVLEEKPAPVPLCPQQIPYELNWPRTQAAAVGTRRLTA